jgi:hypothetical protein
MIPEYEFIELDALDCLASYLGVANKSQTGITVCLV